MKYDGLFGIYMGLELSRSRKLQYLPVDYQNRSWGGWGSGLHGLYIWLWFFVLINYAKYSGYSRVGVGVGMGQLTIHLVTYRISI